MRKWTDRIENNKVLGVFVNREIFTLCYLAVCILLSIPVLISYVSIVAKVCFVWGVGLIGWDLITRRRMLRSAYWLMPLLILAGYGVSVLLNRDVAVAGLKHWLHLAISLLLLYAARTDAPERDLIRTAKRAFVIVNLITFAVSSASLGTFLLKKRFIIEVGGMMYYQGISGKRVAGLYASPNPGSLLALISVLGVLFLFLQKDGKKLKCRWFFLLNVPIQFAYCALALSLGGFFSAIAAAAVLFVLLFLPRFCKKGFSVKKGLAAALVLLLAAGVCFCALRAVTTDDPESPSVITRIAEKTETGKKVIDLIRGRVENSHDTFSNRKEIWSCGWKITRPRLLFGAADADVDSKTAAKRFDLNGMTDKEKLHLYTQHGYMHNVAVQILVYSGAVGVALFSVFALLLVFRIGRVLLTTKKRTRQYHAVAVLCALCAALAVNGAVESHLVYHRQDPIGLLFWFFLGVTVALGDRYRRSAEGVKTGAEDRIALMASTPLQVLNCLSFVQGDAEGSRQHADLYVAHPFRNSEAVSENLKRSGVFDHVYDIDAFEKYGAVKGKLTTFYRLFLPERALKSMARGKLPVKGYSFVAASSQTSASVALHRTYPEARVLMFDDGIGSYLGNMVRDYNSGLFNLLNTVFFDGGLNLDPVKLYLNNPAVSQSELAVPTAALPAPNGESAAAAEKIFGYTANDCFRNKVVYITQPMEEWDGYSKEQEEEILGLVAETFGDRAIGRVHPRQQLESLKGIPVCGIQNLWELECFNQINEDNILIGGFSTAQLTPKLFCDKEPVVIFTLKLTVPGAKKDRQEKILRLIEGFRRSYRDPGRVFLPETMEELAALLKEL